MNIKQNNVKELNRRIKITCNRDKDFLTKEEVGKILNLSEKEIKESSRASLISSLKIRLCKSSKDYKNNLKKIMNDIIIIKFIDYLEKDYLEKDCYLKKFHGMDIDNYNFSRIYMKVFHLEEKCYGKKWFEYNYCLFDKEIDKKYINIIFNILLEYKIFLGKDYLTESYYYINVNMEMVHALYEDLNNLGLIKRIREFHYLISVERYIFNLERFRCLNNNYYCYGKECKYYYQDEMYVNHILFYIYCAEHYPHSNGHYERMEILEGIKKCFIDKELID